MNIARRKLLAAFAGAAGWPFAARAQQPPSMPLIGFLDSKSPEGSAHLVAEFRRGLNGSAFIEGQNVAIEFRWAQDQYDRLPALAADLVRRRVDVIAATGGPAALAAKAASATIPIVFRVAVDPIAAGLVASLNRPAGNVTGVTSLNLEVGPKRLEFLHEMVPTATIMAALVNPTNPSNAEIISRDLQATARLLGPQLHLLHAGSDADIDAVFATLTELRAGGLVIGTDAFFTDRNEKLAALALRYRIPTARSQPTCQWSRRRKLSCSSISRRPRCLASLPRPRYSPAPTRSSNEPPPNDRSARRRGGLAIRSARPAGGGAGDRCAAFCIT
jgi:putative ABC transport system substrate-binding protein